MSDRSFCECDFLVNHKKATLLQEQNGICGYERNSSQVHKTHGSSGSILSVAQGFPELKWGVICQYRKLPVIAWPVDASTEYIRNSGQKNAHTTDNTCEQSHVYNILIILVGS